MPGPGKGRIKPIYTLKLYRNTGKIRKRIQMGGLGEDYSLRHVSVRWSNGYCNVVER
jgi:hypothetical protein